MYVDELVALIGDVERVSVKTADREAHSQDESHHGPHLPDVVIWPESAEEISRILGWANAHHVPRRALYRDDLDLEPEELAAALFGEHILGQLQPDELAAPILRERERRAAIDVEERERPVRPVALELLLQRCGLRLVLLPLLLQRLLVLLLLGSQLPLLLLPLLRAMLL